MARQAPVLETEILKPLDVTCTNENDWPDFLLTSAEVYDAESEDLESLLHAGPSNPLTLSGKLSKSKQLLPYLVKEKLAHTLPISISVPNVQHFCYGQNNDGNAVLWAAGGAGWFQIQPSRAYKTIHKHSCEAVIVLYFLADFYTDLNGRKRKSTPVETVFKQYAQDDSHSCRDETEAEQVFLSHRAFLLDCMAKGKENINWKNTSIYQYLLQNHDDETSDSAENQESNARTPLAKVSSDEGSQRQRAGKSKSSLRPRRSSKYSLKAMGRRSDIKGDAPPQASVEALQSPLKRKTTNGREFRPRKRRTMSPESRDAVMHSASESDASEDSSAEPPLPLSTVPPKLSSVSTHRPRIKIIEEPLPSYDPQGPGDTWICTFDGCSYVVYDARKPENEELIRDHYKQHAVESQTQIDLIYQEERPYLPVNNLIKRIRDLASQSKILEEQPSAMESLKASDREFPKPIRRKWP